MQVINGMGLVAYWISNFVFDIIRIAIPVLAILGLKYAYGIDVRLY